MKLRPTRGVIVAAWLLSIAFDFLLHGGVLARLYLSDSPFLLPPESALARIPLGYLSFLILTVGLACWASKDAWRAEIVPLLLFGEMIAIA